MRAGLSHALGSSSATCRRIWRHPENRGRRLRTIGLYFVWQAWERTVKRPWVITLAPGRKIRCYPHCAVSSGTLYYRLPERSSMRFLVDHLQPGDTMVDVGANVGTYSLLATTVEDVTAVAFEPSSLTYGRAVQNVALNGLQDRISVRQEAVGSASGDAVLSVGLGPCNKVLGPAGGVVEAGERVPMVTLDEVFAEGARRVGLVKIDVEGGEIDVLEGARGVVGRDRPALILEVNDPDRVGAYLHECGYAAYVYDPDTGDLRPTVLADHLHHNVIALYGA